MSQWTTINTLDDLQERIALGAATLAYFSHPGCGVCEVLRPKLAERFSARFPKVELCYVDTQRLPNASGQYNVFTVPTVVLFLDGRETLREARNLSVEKFCNQVQRLYELAVE